MNKLVAIILALAAVSSAQWGNPWMSPYYGWAGWSGLNNFAVRSTWPSLYAAAPAAVAPVRTVAAAPWAPYAPAFTSSQYHAQDELGQASFGYAHPGQSATNYRDAFGNQAGSWSYVDPNGKVNVVNYVADANGFRVLSNNLPEAPVATLVGPQPVEDTPEVAAAKAAHLAALRAAEANDGAVAVASDLPMPEPVQDTAEVAAAKAEHAKLWAEAKALAESSGERKKRQVFAYGGLPLAAPLGFYPRAVVAPVAPAVPVREATLTKTILNPGHAVAYRVD